LGSVRLKQDSRTDQWVDIRLRPSDFKQIFDGTNTYLTDSWAMKTYVFMKPLRSHFMKQKVALSEITSVNKGKA
jgi:hypothetical protein